MKKNFYADLAERAISTYVQSFIGALLMTWGDVIDVSTLRAAAFAAAPAALAVVKGLVASRFGDSDTASLIDSYDPHLAPEDVNEGMPED